MTKQFKEHTQDRPWLLLISISLLGGGCITPDHRAYGLAWEVNADHPAAMTQRNQEYVLLISDANPRNIMRVKQLSEELHKAGYAKTVTAISPFHLGWMKHCVRDLHRQYPDAAFHVGSVPPSLTAVEQWIAEMAGEGLPVRPLPSTLATGQKLSAGSDRSEGETTHPTPAAAPIADMAAVWIAWLDSEASRRPLPVLRESNWSYSHVPPVRPLLRELSPGEWSFIFDDRPAVGKGGDGVRTPQATSPTSTSPGVQ